MTIIIACSIAFFSTTAFIALWFYVVTKELKAKQNILESAKLQLTTSKILHQKVRDAPEKEKAREIFERSLDIYNQSIELYNDTLQKPWNIIPAFFLRYKPVIDVKKQ